tara:strand:- start:1995 stop:2435 length:441 start_codon:yes stop_codon:yes gene_type:complete
MSQNIKLQVSQLTPSENLFEDPQSLLNLIPTTVLATLGTDTERFIIVGHETPGADNRDIPWFRFTSTGDWMGMYIFIRGGWELAPSLPLGTILLVANLDTNAIPFGFALANGTSGSADLSTEFSPAWTVGTTDYPIGYIQYTGLTN